MLCIDFDDLRIQAFSRVRRSIRVHDSYWQKSEVWDRTVAKNSAQEVPRDFVVGGAFSSSLTPSSFENIISANVLRSFALGGSNVSRVSRSAASICYPAAVSTRI